jgi:hypothetical protein
MAEWHLRKLEERLLKRVRGRIPTMVAENAWQRLAADLDAAGFWADMAVADRERLRATVAAGGSPFSGLEEAGWLVDGEELADGSIEQLLNEMSPALAERGVELLVETIEGPWDDGSGGYKLRINGVDVDLYRFDPDEPKLPLAEDPWTDCTFRPLAVVNRLLADAGARERIAVVSPGANDGMAYLLAADAIFVLTKSPVVAAEDRPVIPS